MRFRLIAATVGAAVLLCASSASHAALLNLTQSYPDIFSDFTTISYDANILTLDFNTDGFNETIDYQAGGPLPFDVYDSLGNPGGPHLINIHVDNSGNLIGGVVGDDVFIAGAIDLDRNGSINGSESYQTLLTGEIQQFGWAAGANAKFEFVFKITGGTQAAAFGGVNNNIGTIMTAASSFNGNWNVSWSNTSGGTADTFPVPEPVSASLLGAGLLLLAAKRPRKGSISRVN